MSDSLNAAPDPHALPSDATFVGNPHDLPSDATFVGQGESAHPIQVGPSDSVVNDANAVGNTLFSNALAGVGSMPRAIARGLDWTAGHLPVTGNQPWDLGAERALSHVTQADVSSSLPHPERQVFPDYETLRNRMFEAEGNDNGPATEFRPKSYGGKLAMAGGTAALTAAASSPASIIPAFAGGAGAQIAADTFPEHPFLASLPGYWLGARFGQAAQNAPQRAISATTNAYPSEAYRPFADQQLPTQLSGTVTKNPTMVALEKMAGASKGAGETIAEQRQALLDGWRERYLQNADAVSKVTTPTDLGTSLINNAKTWLANWKAEQAANWNDFYSTIPPTTQVGVRGYQSALNRVQGDFSGAPATGAVLQPATLQKLSTALGVDLGQPGMTTLPLDALKNIRSSIGQKITDPGPVSDIPQATWKTLYRGLTSDIEDAATQAGPASLAAFRKASASTKAGHDLIEQHLQPILDPNAVPEQIAQHVLQGSKAGATRLQAITQAMPQTTPDISSYVLRTMGGNPTNPSPSMLTQAMGGKNRPAALAPESQEILFPAGSPQAQNLADMTAVAKRIKAFENAKPPEDHQILPWWFRAGEAVRNTKEAGFGTPAAIAAAAGAVVAPRLVGMAARGPLGSWTSRVMGQEPAAPALSPRRGSSILNSPNVAPLTPF